MNENGGIRIGVFGAGAIGCFLGGRLAAAGQDVVLVGREAGRAEVLAHGLTLTDLCGRRDVLPPERVAYRTEAAALADRDVVLVTVKSLATAEAARELAPHLLAGARVVSFQNGVRNADVLRAGLPKHTVLAGMVPFNVIRQGDGRFHLGTSGGLVVEASPGRHEAIVVALQGAGFAVEARTDVVRVQWGKLLLNLNNSINALAGIPLREELRDRRYRRALAACIGEGLACVRAAGIHPAGAAGVPIPVVPYVLRAPDFVFERVARAMLTIDPEARSSMWEDLERHRLTEIDVLNGEIVAVADGLGRDAPVNRAVCALVREAERASAGSPRLDPRTLLARLGLA